MAFDIKKGLIAINTTAGYKVLDLSWIQVDSITSTPNQIQDVDSFINGNGYLKRTTLPHNRSKWEANTSILYEQDVQKLTKLLKDGYSVKDGVCDETQRKMKIRYYNEWSASYEEGYFYVPDISFAYKTILNSKLVYQPIRFAFIEY